MVKRASLADSIKLANQMVNLLMEKQIEEIVILDMHELVTYADVFIIGTSQSDIQSRVAADHLVNRLRDAKTKPYHIEGFDDGNWILIDYIDVIVHIFLPKTRKYFNLENLWGDAPMLDLPQK